jgi:hypothetical protein
MDKYIGLAKIDRKVKYRGAWKYLRTKLAISSFSKEG